MYCSFLVQCAKWIGEGPHLDLLQTILAYGYDTTAIEASHFDQWPEMCSTNWISLCHTPDPFFISYIGMILEKSPSKYPFIERPFLFHIKILQA